MALRASCEQVRQVARGYIRDRLDNYGLSQGNLEESVDIDIQGLQGAVGPTLIYGRIHELGGTIYPVNGPYLVFQAPDGQWVRATSVTIPPRPFLQPAMEQSESTIEREVADALGTTWRPW